MGSSINLDSFAIKLPPDAAGFHRTTVADLLQRKNTQFPGAQPVSFGRQHFEELESTDYYLCEKTDGIRCLLFCTCTQLVDGGPLQETYFLIDRKNDYYALRQGFFHLPKPGEDVAAYHPGTILDGELVLQRHPDGTTRNVYLIFDCLCLDGDNITNRTLDVRLGKVKEFVYKPYREFAKAWPDEVAVQPFDVELKAMELPYGMEMMFKDKIPKLLHGNDGLIFTCRTTPYVAGTDQHILKWKPPHENTIDFRLYIDGFPTAEDDQGVYEDFDAMPQIALYVNHGGRDGYRRFAPLLITEPEWEAIKGMGQMIDGRIIECYRDHRTGQWRPKIEDDGTPRFRDDKTDANHISTVNSVLSSIKDAVTEDDLMAHAARIRTAFKDRQRVAEARRADEKKRAVEDHRRREAARAHEAHRPSRPQNNAPPPVASGDDDDDGPVYDDDE